MRSLKILLAAVLSLWFGAVAAAEDLRIEVVQQLKSSGSDVTRPHRFDFYLYLPSEPDARTAAQRLRANDLAVQVRPAAKGSGCLCFASATLIPDTARLTEIGSLLQSLAHQYKGEFDGWESEVFK